MAVRQAARRSVGQTQALVEAGRLSISVAVIRSVSAVWTAGKFVRQSVGQSFARADGCSVGRSAIVCGSVGRSDEPAVVRSVARSVAWSVGRLAGRSIGPCVGLFGGR